MALARSAPLCRILVLTKLLLSLSDKAEGKDGQNVVRKTVQESQSQSRGVFSGCSAFSSSIKEQFGGASDRVAVPPNILEDNRKDMEEMRMTSCNSESPTFGSQGVPEQNKEEEMSLFSSPLFSPQALTEDDEEEVNPSEKAKYIFLAYKALLWGTFYSILGVSLLTVVVMRYFNLHSVSEVLEKLRKKKDTNAIEFQATESNGLDLAGEVKHFELDIQNPTRAWEQLKEIWELVEKENERQ